MRSSTLKRVLLVILGAVLIPVAVWAGCVYITIDGVQVSNCGGGGGGSVTFTNLTPMPSTLGGFEAGTTFNAVNMQNMWNGLLYPYQYPAFSAFGISGQTTPIEVGDSLAINRTFTWSTTNSGNVATNSISLTDVTGGNISIATGLPNTGSYISTYPSSPITKTSATTHSFRVDGLNTYAQNFNRTYTMTWQWKRYYGESSSAGPLTESDIESLRVGGLASGFSGAYVFSAGGYKYISYPTAFGTATTFKDASTNFDVPFEDPYTVSVTNSFGVTTTYRVHRSTNILGAAITINVS